MNTRRGFLGFLTVAPFFSTAAAKDALAPRQHSLSMSIGMTDEMRSAFAAHGPEMLSPARGCAVLPPGYTFTPIVYRPDQVPNRLKGARVNERGEAV